MGGDGRHIEHRQAQRYSRLSTAVAHERPHPATPVGFAGALTRTGHPTPERQGPVRPRRVSTPTGGGAKLPVGLSPAQALEHCLSSTIGLPHGGRAPGRIQARVCSPPRVEATGGNSPGVLGQNPAGFPGGTARLFRAPPAPPVEHPAAGPPSWNSRPGRIRVSSPERRRRLAGGYLPRRDQESPATSALSSTTRALATVAWQWMPLRAPTPGPGSECPLGHQPQISRRQSTDHDRHLSSPPVPRGLDCVRRRTPPRTRSQGHPSDRTCLWGEADHATRTCPIIYPPTPI